MSARFALLRAVHSGPRSLVFAADDRQTGARVAVKISPNARAEVGNLLRAAGCDPRMVVALAVGRAVGARELCFGGLAVDPAARAMPACVTALHPPAPEDPPICAADRDAARSLRPYFEAVAELHGRSPILAHCDVKYANFVAPGGGGGRCLIDFELAAREGDRSGSRKRGTPAFMSPEMTAYGEANRGTDPWALGIMLFQACHPDLVHPHFGDRRVDSDGLERRLALADYGRGMWRNRGAPLASDLAALLLASDPGRRLSPGEALEHRLFAEA